MMIRFNRTLSIFCAVALLICAVSAWAYAEQTPATPSDLTPVEEAPVTEQTEEEPAESVEVIITKTLGINQSWEGRMKKTKPAVLKLDLSSPCTVYMLVEGQDVWATVEKSDRLTEDPARTQTDSETGRMIISWEAEAGSYLITLGPVEPNLLAMATVTFMDTAAYETWEPEQEENEPEPDTEMENEPEEEQQEEKTENEPEPTDVIQQEETDENEKPPVDILTLLPEDRSISYEVLWDVEEPAFGDTAHFVSSLKGYDKVEHSIQWQYSEDDTNWNDIYGATDETMDIVASEENYLYYWRVMVYVYLPEE